MVIPNGVAIIEDHAFAYCGSLKNIAIPSSVSCIGDSAFFMCESLPNITIPHNCNCNEPFGGGHQQRVVRY